jgi:hypothetical protein
MPYLVPEGPILEDAFDKFIDKSCLTEGKESWTDKLSKISYKRPADVHVRLYAFAQVSSLPWCVAECFAHAEP